MGTEMENRCRKGAGGNRTGGRHLDVVPCSASWSKGVQMKTKQVYRPGGKPIVIKTRSGWALAVGLAAIAVAIVVAGTSVLSLLAWHWLKGERVASSKIVDAKVFKVAPKDIDCRAVIGSAITADA